MLSAKAAAGITALIGAAGTAITQSLAGEGSHVALTWGMVVTLAGSVGSFFVTRHRAESAHARITKFQQEVKDERLELTKKLDAVTGTVEAVGKWIARQEGIAEGEHRAEVNYGRRQHDRRPHNGGT